MIYFFLLTRQECEKKEEYGDLKTYEASQRSNNSSLSKIIIKSKQKKYILKAKRSL